MMEAANILKQVIGTLSKVCTKSKVALVCTGDANTTARGIIPKPIGGIYLKHATNAIVHFKEFSKTSGVPSFKATLIKHQYSFVCEKSRGNDAARLRSDDIWAE